MRPHRSSRHKLGVIAAAALVVPAILAGCDPAPNGHVDQLTILGDGPTEGAMDVIAALYNADTSYNKDRDVLWNIHAFEDAATQPHGLPLTVPADANCGSTTWDIPAATGELQPPLGSDGGSAGLYDFPPGGRDYLSQSVQAANGCVDVSRSSLSPRAIGTLSGWDLPTFQYFAYGLDAVSAASASTLAPSNLTLAQLQGIFTCTYTNWSQVGGDNGQIQRYWPILETDTAQNFHMELLGGFDPTTVSTASCPPVITTLENTGADVYTRGDLQRAIVPFSAAEWVAQARGTSLDTRDGQKILSLNGQDAVVGSGANAHLNAAPGPVQESNVRLNDPVPAYPGIHYVFNVLDSSSKAYSQAQYFLGFGTESGSKFKSLLCNGTFASVIQAYGFVPLNTTVSPHNPAGSTCRLFTP